MHTRLAIRLLVVLLLILLFPILVRAQNEIRLETFSVDFLPEYDDPDMLIIEKFRLPAESALPVSVTFRLPALARVNAVAYEKNGELFYVPSTRLSIEDGLQVATFQVEYPLEYRLEYYIPLKRNGLSRKFTYRWASDYTAEHISIKLNLPPDATNVSTEPALTGNAHVLTGDFPTLQAGEAFTLTIEYQRPTNAVQTYQQPVQPAQPLNSSPGWTERMTTLWPWILGLAGVALIVGGGWYYWSAGRGRKTEPRKRHAVSGAIIHCHQCGQRARPGDRFCRICGTRLHQDG